MRASGGRLKLTARRTSPRRESPNRIFQRRISPSGSATNSLTLAPPSPLMAIFSGVEEGSSSASRRVFASSIV